MKYRYKINEQSYVVVDDSNGQFHAQHFKNGCSHNLMDKRADTIEEIEQWIKQLKELMNGGV